MPPRLAGTCNCAMIGQKMEDMMRLPLPTAILLASFAFAQTGAAPTALPTSGGSAQGGMPVDKPDARLARIDGVQTWRIDVPTNGSAQLDYAALVRRN